ncbi:MAG: hypothetical protein ACK4F8_03765 [Aquabacterium sp.]
MKQPKLRHLPLAAAALVACSGAMAGYTSPDGSFSLSGFGTVGLSGTSNDEVLFVYPGQGGGSNQSPSLNPDTKAALQGTYKFAPTVSATGQVMAKYNAYGQYTPNVEWAFGKWQVLPSLSVRAGRMGAPLFMVSDFRDVGYANTAVRPNLDVYGQVPFSSFEGADTAYQTNFGSVTLTSTLWTGTMKSKYASALRSGGAAAEPAELVLKKTVGLNLVAETDGGLTFRAGHTQGKLTVNSASGTQITGLANAVIGAGTGLSSPFPTTLSSTHAALIADAVTTSNTDASFSGIGLAYDQDDIVLGAEFTKRKVKKGYIPDTKGWYALAGYRFGAWLPYVSISRLSVEDPNVSVPSVLSLYGAAAQNPSNPALVRQAAGGVFYGLPGLLNTQKVTENTKSIGVRWDASAGVALKAQFDHVSVPAGSNGLFLMADPVAAAQGGSTFLNKRKDINVLSVSVDFVF